MDNERNKTGFELNTPVAFVIFNRPDCVKISFDSIRKARPKELYIIADGPREDHPDDKELCSECRSIVENVDWDCEVYKNYSDINLGCGARPATGISWVFSHTDRAIIIEDDCVPSMSFYRFCQDMLERYKDDSRIFSISGMNYDYTSDNGADYYFAHISNSTGWASWSRVWNKYHFEINDFDEEECFKKLLEVFIIPEYARYWLNVFKDVIRGRHTSAWDYQFSYYSFMNNGLHVFPQKNLVEYIGYGEDATHSTGLSEGRFYDSTKRAFDLSFPLKHPLGFHPEFLVDYLRMRDMFHVSPDHTSIVHHLSVGFINKICKYQDIIIYGAGAVCRDVILLLNHEHVDIFYIAASRPDAGQYVMGNKVFGLKELLDKRENAIVIIAVSKKYVPEMIDNLMSVGFQNYICVIDEIEKS